MKRSPVNGEKPDGGGCQSFLPIIDPGDPVFFRIENIGQPLLRIFSRAKTGAAYTIPNIFYSPRLQMSSVN